MKKSKFTEEQILFALKQAEAGQPVGDVCRQMALARLRFTFGRSGTGTSDCSRFVNCVSCAMRTRD